MEPAKKDEEKEQSSCLSEKTEETAVEERKFP